jgi:hypothetical protein
MELISNMFTTTFRPLIIFTRLTDYNERSFNKLPSAITTWRPCELNVVAAIMLLFNSVR